MIILAKLIRQVTVSYALARGESHNDHADEHDEELRGEAEKEHLSVVYQQAVGCLCKLTGIAARHRLVVDVLTCDTTIVVGVCCVAVSWLRLG